MRLCNIFASRIAGHVDCAEPGMMLGASIWCNMPSAAVKRYWDWLPDICPCGAMAECVHHVIHVNWQRITKDDWLVCKLCNACHTALHGAGGDRKFYNQTTGRIDTVHLAVLNRHNFEVSRA